MLTKEIFIDREQYTVKQNEFQEIQHNMYNNLKLYTDITFLEKCISLSRDILESFGTHKHLAWINFHPKTFITHGGFLVKNCLKYFKGTKNSSSFSFYISLYDEVDPKLYREYDFALIKKNEVDKTFLTHLYWKEQ